MAEREGIAQLPYYDDPEALALARKASEQMADHEFIVDKQYPLPPEAQFGGILGTVSGIGYGGDFPQTGKMATIRSMGGLSADKDRRYKTKYGVHTSDTFKHLGAILGQYVPKDIPPEVMKKFDFNPDFQPGIAPGSVHYYKNRDMLTDLAKDIDTPEQADRYIAYVIDHELFHRGVDVLPIDALEKYASQKVNELSFMERRPNRPNKDLSKYIHAKRFFQNLNFSKNANQFMDHEYTRVLQKVIDPAEKKEPLQEGDEKKLRELAAADEIMREFFTPERQEQYQIRLPTRSAEPKETELPTRSAEPEEKGLGALFRRLFD